jgi:hypothetical protein
MKKITWILQEIEYFPGTAFVEVMKRGGLKTKDREMTEDQVREASKKLGVCYYCKDPAPLQIDYEMKFEDETKIYLKYACSECLEMGRLTKWQLRYLDRAVSKEAGVKRRSRNIGAPIEAYIETVRESLAEGVARKRAGRTKPHEKVAV